MSAVLVTNEKKHGMVWHTAVILALRKTVGSGVQGHRQLSSKLVASLGSRKPALRDNGRSPW